MRITFQILYSLFLFSIILPAVQANDTTSVQWQDTLKKYVRTPPDVSIVGFESAFEQSSLPDSTRADMLVTIVNDYAQLGRVDDAINAAKAAIVISKKLKDDTKICRALLTLAWTQRGLGQFDQVLISALNAEEIALKMNDTVLMIMASNTIASVYYDFNNDSLQEVYLENSYQLGLESGNTMVYYPVLENLSHLYQKEDKIDMAILMSKKALEIEKNLGDRAITNVMESYETLADYYDIKEEYSQSITYSDSMLFLLKKFNLTDQIVLNQAKKAFYRSRNGENVNSQGVLLELNKLEGKNLDIDGRKNILFNQYRINKEFENYELALYYQEKFRIFSDSIVSEDLREKIAQYKEKFETEKKESQIIQLESEKELSRLKSVQKDKQILYMTLGLLGLLLFVVTLVILYKKLSTTKLELEELNRVKNKFFGIISHDLRSSVNAFNGIGLVIKNHVKKERWDRVVSVSEKIDVEASKLSVFIENLLSWSLAQMGRVEYNPVSLNVKQKVTEELTLLDSSIKTKDLKLRIEIENTDEFFVDRNGISLVIRNIISNAIKYSYKGGVIEIQSETTDNSLKLSFRDYGKGMSKPIVNSLFAPDLKLSEIGTQGEEGTGLGLVLVKEIIELNNGEISAVSEPDKGSAFTIIVPIRIL